MNYMMGQCGGTHLEASEALYNAKNPAIRAQQVLKPCPQNFNNIEYLKP